MRSTSGVRGMLRVSLAVMVWLLLTREFMLVGSGARVGDWRCSRIGHPVLRGIAVDWGKYMRGKCGL